VLLTLIVVVSLAQDVPASTSLLSALGPFIVYAIPTGMWIRELLARSKESRNREQVLSDRLVELAERTLPAITENTRVLGEVLDELRRLQAKRDR
jgi:LytS/YehU family sensor histidine kinase